MASRIIIPITPLPSDFGVDPNQAGGEGHICVRLHMFFTSDGRILQIHTSMSAERVVVYHSRNSRTYLYVMLV